MEDDKSANQPMDEKEDNDEDLAFGEEFEDQLRKKKARVKGATKPTGDIKLVLRDLDLDALRELVKSVKDDDWSLQNIQDALDIGDMSLQNIQDALDVVDMDDPKEGREQFLDSLRVASFSLWAGENIYVHCLAGVHRGAMAATGYRAVMCNEPMAAARLAVESVRNVALDE